MIGQDEIVEEVRAVREAYAARFDYNIRRICDDVKVREEASDHTIADLRPLEPQRLRRRNKDV